LAFVQRLVAENPIFLNELDEKKMSPLFIAMIFGHYEVAKWLIDYHPNIPHRDANRNSAIHFAIYLRSVKLVERLISAGADLRDENQDYSQNRCIHLAMMTGSVTIAEILLQHGCPLNCRTQYGPNPLFSASLVDRLDIFKWAVSKDPSLLEATDSDSFSPFHHAAWYGSTKIVSWMIMEDLAQVDSSPNPEIWASTLEIAVGNGSAELTKWILDNHPDCSLSTASGRTLAELAAEMGHPVTLRLLLDVGILINQYSSAICACIRTASTECLTIILKETELDLLTVERHVDPPLPFYILDSDSDDPIMLQYLMTAGCNIRLCNASGNSVMIEACAKGKLNIVKWLFRHGMAIQQISLVTRESCLQTSIAHDHPHIMRWLLQHGAEEWSNLCDTARRSEASGCLDALLSIQY
jgi:ankyrin repeat protein